MCSKGHPNLCRRLHFCGNFPDGGSFCEWMHMPAASCFPVPKAISDDQAALLEPLGVALHAVDLAKFRIADSAVIIGAGPIGLFILQMAKRAGADPVFISDKFPWRLQVAEKYGAIPICSDKENPVERVRKETQGRGVDVSIEAAWADHSVEQASEMARLGGRMVLVGIPSVDRLDIKASTVRRKGLTIRMSRRMKHVYPRAMHLAEQGLVDIDGMISHRFPLRKVVEAFAPQRRLSGQRGQGDDPQLSPSGGLRLATLSRPPTSTP